MTERPTTTSGESIDTTLSSDWQAQFSLMAGRAGTEIEAWAIAQEGVGVSAIAGTAVDDDITVTLESGMIVVHVLDTSTGKERRKQEFDPATSDRIIISAGGGNDVITVDEAVMNRLLIAGGNGHDFN